MAAPLRSVMRVQRALLVARSAPRLATALPMRAAASAATSTGKPLPGDYSSHFKIERIFAAGMVPLIPAAYFIHGPVMDAALSAALVLHIHWGVSAVIHDYARPFVIGDTLAKAAYIGAYVITALLLAGLLHFNTNDVGLTRAFELVFSL